MANGGALDKAKRRITDIVDNTESSLRRGKSLLRVGLVAYRDVWDDGSPRLETDLVLRHVQRLVPRGGMDHAEDVFGGLQEVSKSMLWNSPDNRILVHFADSPCHGRHFHDQPEHDALYDSKDYGRRHMKEVLKQLKTKGVKYFFVKFGSSTTQMVQAFRALANSPDFPIEYDISEDGLSAKVVHSMVLGPSRAVPSAMPRDVAPTAGESQRTEPGQASNGNYCDQDVLPKDEPPLQNSESAGIIAGKDSSKSPTGDILPPSTTSIPNRAPAHGGSVIGAPNARPPPPLPSYSDAFRDLNPWSVIKSENKTGFVTFKHSLDEQHLTVTSVPTDAVTQVQIGRDPLCMRGGTWGVIKRALLDEHPAYPSRGQKVALRGGRTSGLGSSVKQTAEHSVVARFIAKRFSRLNSTGCSKVEFVTSCLLQPTGGDQSQSVCMEAFLDNTTYSDFTTWSKHGDFFDGTDQETHPILEAFTHFSNVFTNGRFMVVNLKGARRKSDNAYMLTGPVISAVESNNNAIATFSRQHTCNYICKDMKLQPRSLSISTQQITTDVRSESARRPTTPSGVREQDTTGGKKKNVFARGVFGKGRFNEK